MDDFEDIRPYHDAEVGPALERLTNDPELTSFLGQWLAPSLSSVMPGRVASVVSWLLRKKFSSVVDIAGFQEVISAYAKKLVREGTSEFVYEGFDQLEEGRAYLFISNHRDIAGDSMLLDYALYLNGLDTVRIAIGDNLIQKDFATSLMRLNKGFFIKRSVQGHKKAYAALMQSSKYIHQSLGEGQSVWIAQSEGRSKDGLDVTDPAIVKMLLLADRKKPLAEVVDKLCIMPLSISYEFDPCDVLKAKELGTFAMEGHYQKPPGEDLISLVRGLTGQKGRVVLRLGSRLTGSFETPDEVAAAIDYQILKNLELFPVNYWALSRVDDPSYRSLSNHFESRLKKSEERFLTERLRLCPPTYRPYWLEIYANPVMNRNQVLNQ